MKGRDDTTEEIVFEYVSGAEFRQRRLCPFCKKGGLRKRILFQWWELSCDRCGYKEEIDNGND